MQTLSRRKEYAAEYQQRDYVKARRKIWNKANVQKTRRLVIDRYGGVCACCGEKEIKFLAIDHINGGGNAMRKAGIHEKGHGMYRWLINNDFPAIFRVLCHNCNMAIGLYGLCPHKKGGV